MRYPMTLEGAKALEKELEILTKEKRPAIIKAIATARELGDLKENAEYHSAREQQGLVEARIRDIEGRMQNSQIIDIAKIEPTGRVLFGVTIKIIDINSDEEFNYKIVGEDEANIKQNKISVSSPVGKALIGKSIGDIIQVKTPKGITEYEILQINHI